MPSNTFKFSRIIICIQKLFEYVKKMTKPRVSQNKHDQVYIQNFIVSTLTLMNKVKTRKAKAGGGVDTDASARPSQIYLDGCVWSCPKSIISCPYHTDTDSVTLISTLLLTYLLTCANLHQNRFICLQNIAFTTLVRDERTGRWMNGQPENIMPLPTSLAWWRHNTSSRHNSSACQSGLVEAQ